MPLRPHDCRTSEPLRPKGRMHIERGTARRFGSRDRDPRRRGIGDPEVGAAAILLPQILALDAAAKVFLALVGQVGWTVTRSILQDPPAGEMVAVHVVRAIPFGGTSCPSEALVSAPFRSSRQRGGHL